MNLSLSVFTLAAVVALSVDVQAQDSTKAAPPPPPPPPFASVTGDLGYVSTTGNANVSTLNASDALTIRPSARNEIDQTLALIYGMSQNHVNSNQWDFQLRDVYKFNPYIGLYALGGFHRDPFAGVNQSYEEGLGVTVTAFDQPHDHLDFALGASDVQQKLLPDSTNTHVAGRLSALYKHTFMKDTYVQEAIAGLPDFNVEKDYRINSQTDLVAPLSRHLAIKIGYGIHYANLPPTGFKTTDRLLTTDLQITY